MSGKAANTHPESSSLESRQALSCPGERLDRILASRQGHLASTPESCLVPALQSLLISLVMPSLDLQSDRYCSSLHVELRFYHLLNVTRKKYGSHVVARFELKLC